MHTLHRIVALALLAATLAAHPTFTTASIVNSAGFQPPELKGGAIARGAIFSIFGKQLGPRASVTAARLPLEPWLGDVRVLITSPDSQVLQAPPLFVSSSQINAIMPSDAPLGEAMLQVEYEDGDGRPLSIPIPVRIVESAFGAFSIDGAGRGPAIATNFVSQSDQPLNSTIASARPGQLITLWGTGLGGVPGADRDSPATAGGVIDLQEIADVEVFVGGRPATNLLYAGRSAEFPGLDQIVFAIPEDAPQGCYAPVWVTVRGGVTSNVTTLSISEEGGRCEDPLNPYWATGPGAAVGAIALDRLTFEIGGDRDHRDTGAGVFQRLPPTGWFFNPTVSLSPAGTCHSFVERNRPGGLPNPTPVEPIDTGDLTVRRGAEARFLPRTAPGVYAALFGSSDRGDAFLEPGPVSIESGDVDAQAEQPAPFEWRLEGLDGIIDRSSDARVVWDGTSEAGLVRVMLVSASSANPNANVVTTLACTAQASAGELRIPAGLLAQAPASIGEGPSSTATLYVGRISSPADTTFEADGLDFGWVIAATLTGRPVRVR